ncbi:MAG: hypothetical protein ABH824_03010 [Nanoarchaeota archaeon]|nr:hypothetical protein [Nanoarchaeota archaeon]MBU1631739.1 hypothetical protein [Nanoarchaeota archaeon]MBU1875543.1 hypothetical protein [Nanoarchaeota archaeon]
MKKKHRIKIIYFFVFLLIISSITAIGIAPAVIKVDYSPGITNTFTFFIVQINGNVKLEAYGDLASEITLSKDILITEGSTNEVEITYTIGNLTPGKHSLYLKATEIPKEEYGKKSTISALGAIVGRIETYVPYPDKYAAISLEYEPKVKLGDKAYFTVTLENQGSITIDKASGQVKIMDLKENELVSVPLTEVFGISKQNKNKLYAEWNTEGTTPGKYKIKAIVDYDGNITGISGFNIWIGDINLEVLNMTPIEFPKNQISSVNLLVKNVWNEGILFYADLLIKDVDGKILKKTTSQTLSISQWRTENVNIFVDTNGLELGDYDAEVILHYSEKEARKSFKIKIIEPPKETKKDEVVQEPKSSISSTTLIYTTIILVALVVIIYLYYKRKGDDDEEF